MKIWQQESRGGATPVVLRTDRRIVPRRVAVNARARTHSSKLPAYTLALLFAYGTTAPAFAGTTLPTGGSVAAGSAAISQTGNTLNINQSTNSAIINWQSFSVGPNGTVNFNQPSSSSSTLNRVLSSTPSWIAGTINAPGTVLLVNPNGIAIMLQALMQKNPDLTFGIQESFPLKGTYADAVPLGPVMELRAPDGPSAFTPEAASQSVDYWRNTTAQLLADPAAVNSPDALKSYSHDAVAAANLLAGRNYSSEAEQAYQLAAQIWPENPEATLGLASLLAASGHTTEATQLLETFAQKHPGQQQAVAGWVATMHVDPTTPHR